MKLDPDHESFAAHFFDERMFRPQRVDFFHQQRAHLRGVLDQLFVVDHFQRCQSARHRQIVAAECGRMDDATVHARKGFLVNIAPRHDRAAGHVTAAQRLCQRDDVRLQIPMLKSEHFSGATKPGLHFVGDEQRAVFSAEFLRANEEIGLGV